MTLGRTAVVLGGSVAGLCSAGALAPYFDAVVVLERDELPPDARHRRGVPQSKHPHFLLNSGRRAVNDLFPGFEEDLIAAGGLHLTASMDTAYLEGPGWTPRKQGALDMRRGLSRPSWNGPRPGPTEPTATEHHRSPDTSWPEWSPRSVMARPGCR